VCPQLHSSVPAKAFASTFKEHRRRRTTSKVLATATKSLSHSVTTSVNNASRATVKVSASENLIDCETSTAAKKGRERAGAQAPTLMYLGRLTA